MNSKALLLSLVLVAVCQCGSALADVAVKESAVDIVYSKDSRTGLCFGTTTSYASAWYQVASITNVPCEAVEKLLVKESAVGIVYSKDSRTGLCFGTTTSYASAWYQVASITNVPCEALEHPTVK